MNHNDVEPEMQLPKTLEVRICTLQPNLRQPGECPLETTRCLLKNMDQVSTGEEAQKRKKIDLFVLPELSPVGYSEDTFQMYLPRTRKLQQMYREIDKAFASKARDLQCYVSYGTIGWKLPHSNSEIDVDNEIIDSDDKNDTLHFFIRQITVNNCGHVVSSYDKIHLCDYGDCSETRFFQRGTTESLVFSIRGMRFGTIICADMRYPNLARSLVWNQHAHVLLQPAAFARDISFRTWKSFRETRAVENGVYFVGVNYAGENYGETSIVPPWVDPEHEPLVMDCSEGVLIGTLKASVLHHARTAMPFYRHLIQSEGRACCRGAFSLK